MDEVQISSQEAQQIASQAEEAVVGLQEQETAPQKAESVIEPEELKKDIVLLPRGRYLAAASYLGLPALLAFSNKANDLRKFHGKQGLALLFAWMILGIFAWIPWVGWIVGFFGQLAIFVAMFFGMRSAVYGKFWKVPILGEYAQKLEI